MEVFANLICRPPRKDYKMEELGPVEFGVGDYFCSRRDLELINDHGNKIQCSHYIPKLKSSERHAPVPCVVYLHGNSGSRIDADDLVDSYLARGISLFSLDFSGCGKSEGEYVTLGARERSDVEAALDYLEASPLVSCSGILGRSMGAATALLVAGDEEYSRKVKCIVLDSVYCTIGGVVREMADKYVGKVPILPFKTMIEPAVESLRQAVLAKTGHDFDSVEIAASASRCKVPCIIGHASDDQLVLPHHSEEVYSVYGQEGGGKARLVLFDGDHNSVRPREFTRESVDFFKQHLVITQPRQDDGEARGITGWLFAARGRKDEEPQQEMRPLGPSLQSGPDQSPPGKVGSGSPRGDSSASLRRTSPSPPPEGATEGSEGSLCVGEEAQQHVLGAGRGGFSDGGGRTTGGRGGDVSLGGRELPVACGLKNANDDAALPPAEGPKNGGDLRGGVSGKDSNGDQGDNVLTELAAHAAGVVHFLDTLVVSPIHGLFTSK